MSNDRMIAICIGVSDAKPLPHLAGAINSAKAFAAWSEAVGYETLLISDENEPVTVPRLRREIENSLHSPEVRIRRLIIYFAGHGLIREIEEGLWLLSDWKQELRAVAVEPLKRRLFWYDISQITMIADACRSLPTNVDVADLVPDAVLGSGPKRTKASPAIDKFISTQDGAETFVVPGATPAEDRCIFSGVLLEGISGLNPAAFSKITKTKVTSRSLGAYLLQEVPARAAQYKRNLTPTVSPTFPEDDDCYFASDAGIKVPALPPWPQLLELRIPPSPLPVDEGGIASFQISRPKSLTWGFPSFAKRRSAPSARIQARLPPADRGISCGFTAGATRLQSIAIGNNYRATFKHGTNWWEIDRDGSEYIKEPVPALIECENGSFVAVTFLPNFLTWIVHTHGRTGAVLFSSPDSPFNALFETNDALAQLETGALRADAVTELTVKLRQWKHIDPVLGVISAYLYDSIGDIDSIRRMAFFYVQNQQPIPFDIALLAQLEGGIDKGLLFATVPDVKARKPRNESERQHEWTFCATSASTGVVAGYWPLMRQGWFFLDETAQNDSGLIAPGLTDLLANLTPSRFTTFDFTGARQLASLFNLTRNF